MNRTYDRWIFTKAREYTPDGTLQVGQILGEAFDPAYSLMPGGPKAVPVDIKKEATEQTNVNMDHQSDLTAIFGLWISVAGLPVAANLGGHMKATDQLSWHFDKLSGLIISPSVDYVKASLKHGDVPAWIKKRKWHWGRRLYIVTGVRVVHGARLERSSTRESGAHESLQADLSETGAPLSLGEKAAYNRSAQDRESFDNASDFVYAYRLSEVKYSGEPTHRPYKKGEAQGEGPADDDSEDEDDEEGGEGGEDEVTYDIEIDGIGDDFSVGE